MSNLKEEKSRSIFLNNMNSWLSNFIIEELRTEIYEKNPKVIQNKFYGTLNNNPNLKLPRLFEPTIVEISYAHHYDDELFKKDVFIYSLDDSDLNEIEYIIRGLKYHAKDKEEKVLILISNIMTWGRTPPKEVKTNDDDESFTIDDQNNLDLSANASLAKKHIYYYSDKDYNQRVPSNKYLNYKFIENLGLASANTNKSLIVYIICPGFIYGCGEIFFYEFFKMAWYQNPRKLPVLENSNNIIPTIHVIDLARIVKYIIERRPIERYIFAFDKTKDRTLKSIIKSISSSIGNGEISIIPYNSQEIELFPNLTSLIVDIKAKPSSFLDQKQEFISKKTFDWHCEYGISENGLKIKSEFKEYRNLKNIKILITGMPGSGKSTLAQLLSKELNLPIIQIHDLIEYTKSLNNELSHEVNSKIEELINKQVEEAEAALAKKKQKQVVPIERTQFIARLPDEMIIKIYKSKLNENISQNVGYILDGYPRNIQECKKLFFSENPKTQINIETSQLTQIKNNKMTKEQMYQIEKEKYNEEYGNLLIEKEICPYYVLNITNISEETIKMRIKENVNQIEGGIINEERFNRRIGIYKQQQYYSHNLLGEYGVDIINLDAKTLNDPDFLVKKSLEELEKFDKLKRTGTEIRRTEEEDFNLDNHSEIIVEGEKEEREDTNLKYVYIIYIIS